MCIRDRAAPAYIIAKDIIHMILCLQQIIEKDPEVKPYLNVVMVKMCIRDSITVS